LFSGKAAPMPQSGTAPSVALSNSDR